jgi:hypothetical protein
MHHVACIIVAGLTATAACAGIVGVSGGTESPPATLGPFTLVEFERDTRPLQQEVFNIPSPLGGIVELDQAVWHVRIGAGWADWSHGYRGDVYHTGTLPFTHSRTLDLSDATTPQMGGVGAFRLSMMPSDGDGGIFRLVARTRDGDELAIDSYPAFRVSSVWSGFYATQDDQIESVRIEWSAGAFAIGEFAIAAIPEPATLLLVFAFAGLSGFRPFMSGG